MNFIMDNDFSALKKKQGYCVTVWLAFILARNISKHKY